MLIKLTGDTYFRSLYSLCPMFHNIRANLLKLLRSHCLRVPARYILKESLDFIKLAWIRITQVPSLCSILTNLRNDVADIYYSDSFCLKESAVLDDICSSFILPKSLA